MEKMRLTMNKLAQDFYDKTQYTIDTCMYVANK